jgi:hypothetical protein
LTLKTMKGPTEWGLSFWQGKREIPSREPDGNTSMENGSLTAVAVHLILLTADRLSTAGPWSGLESTEPGLADIPGRTGRESARWRSDEMSSWHNPPRLEPGPLPLLVLAVTP